MVRSHNWLSTRSGIRWQTKKRGFRNKSGDSASRFLAVVLLGATALMLSSCSREEQITQYEVEREETPDTNEHTAVMPPHAPPPTGRSPLTYDTPEGWKLGRVRGLRKAAFRVEDGSRKVDITVIDLPAAVGQMLLDNVNEWRRQIHLDPITEAELENIVRPIEVAGGQGHYVELLGPEDDETRTAILAVIAIHGAKSWFFKVSGDAELALREKDRFQDFVKSVEFETPAEGPKRPLAKTPKPLAKEPRKIKPAPPVTTPHFGLPTVPAGGTRLRVQCESPNGWTPGEAQGLRKAAFRVEHGDQTVEITVTQFPASIAKLLLLNVNRWCKQVQRDELTQDELTQMLRPVQVAGTEGQYVELVGPEDAKPRLAILGVVAVCEGRAWFLKMKGDAELALREKDRFQHFVQSVRFTAAEAPKEKPIEQKPVEEKSAGESPAGESAAGESAVEGGEGEAKGVGDDE